MQQAYSRSGRFLHDLPKSQIGRILGSMLVFLISPGLIAQQDTQDQALLDALELSAETAAQMASYEDMLSSLRSEAGPFDMRQQEVLNDMTAVMIENGEYETALSLLDQELQLLKVNQGLYSAEQVPVIEQQLKLHFKKQDWEAVNSGLNHLSWLYSRDSEIPVPEKLAGLYQLRDWQLLALNHDYGNQEAEHLLSIKELSERALTLAETHYGKNSPEVISYIYGAAQADLYIALAIMLTPDTSSKLITLTEGIRAAPASITQIRSERDLEIMYGPKATSVINRSFKSNMNNHYRHISRIRDYYAQNGNKEAEAMAVLLLGDSRLLEDQYEFRPMRFAGEIRGMGNIGFASKYYKEASELLLQTGYNKADIDQYFACPMLLPVAEFNPQFQPSERRCDKPDDLQTFDLGQVHLLVDSVPEQTQMEATVNPEDDLQTFTVSDVSFTVMSNGQPGRVDVLKASPDSTRNKVRAKSTVDRLQFRPALEEGRAVRMDNVMMTLVLPE